jgi:uncharacterized damage-inducible protein DinB
MRQVVEERGIAAEVETQSRSSAGSLVMLLQYKERADRISFEAVMSIPEEEALKTRLTTFKNMVHTLNHVYVIDDTFRHHLIARKHGYTMRNTIDTPSISELWLSVQEMDRWYIDQVKTWTDDDLRTIVEFEFVGDGLDDEGGDQLHIVNHTTYHRGFVGDMLKQVPYNWPANDLPVFIRDHYRPA